MKKFMIGSVILGIIGAAFLGHLVQSDFNAEKILAQSALSGRQFKGKVKEISDEAGTVHAYFMEEHSVPIVAIAFEFAKSGWAYEKKRGTAQLMESVLLDGAGTYDRKALRAVMKEKGIKLGVSVDEDRLRFSFSYIKAFEKEALDVLKAVLYAPRFEKEDLNLAKAQLNFVKKQQPEDPEYRLSRLIDETFYRDHPYGMEEIPDKEALEAVKREDILAYLQESLSKDNLSVGLAGDLNETEARAFLSDMFGGLAAMGGTRELAPVQADFKQEKVSAKVPFSGQSFVTLLGKGVKRLDDDFYPLYVADYILGGSGLASKLNQGVREKEGLTYGIYSGFINTDGIDLWQVSFSATPENANKALLKAQDIYQNFYDNGVSEQEVELAKKSLISSFNLRFSSLLEIAVMLEQMKAQGLGVDFLEKRQGYVAEVTVQKVNDAIKRRMPKRLDEKGEVRIFEVIGKKI